MWTGLEHQLYWFKPTGIQELVGGTDLLLRNLDEHLSHVLVCRQPLLGPRVTKTNQRAGYEQEKDQRLEPWMGHVTLGRPQNFF